MLTEKELELFKICELPRESALIWIERIKNREQILPFDDTGYYRTGQTTDIGGDITELVVYKHSSNGLYYLIQGVEE